MNHSASCTQGRVAIHLPLSSLNCFQAVHMGIAGLNNFEVFELEVRSAP